MNVVLVLAGGSGKRTRQDIPKQFLNVNDKPIIVYTFESFEKHPDIDAIMTVCIDGWQEILWAYSKQFHVTKLRWVVPGGNSVQESIRNGVFALREHCKPSDIVIVHDGIRPLVEDEVVSDVIVKCRKYGNAVTSLPYNDQIFVMSEDRLSTTEYIPRETLRRVQTPQAYTYEKLLWGYETAFAKNIGISGSSYTNTMMVDLGETLHFAAGSDRNIKITTLEDIELFKGFVQSNRSKVGS